MKIYVAGKITGEDREKCIYKFGYAASTLRNQGHKAINPKELLKSMENQNFDYEDFMVMCFAAIDVCDAVFMIEDWHDSPGARREHEYALNKGKQIIYQNVKV